VGSVGIAKQQNDLKRSFSQIYQIDLSISVDRTEQSEQVEKEHSQSRLVKQKTTSNGMMIMK